MAIYSIKIIVNKIIFEVGISIHLNLWVYHRNSEMINEHKMLDTNTTPWTSLVISTTKYGVVL